MYWATIIATTTLGTTLADFADRSLGIGYIGGTCLLLSLLLVSLLVWHRVVGKVSVHPVTVKAEGFYWVTIMFSQTLGTALGDWTADAQGLGLGYEVAALVFAAGLLVVVGGYLSSRVSHVLLFWAAFVLTRPLGAVVGDFLDKPLAQGGLDLSRAAASLALLAAMALVVVLFQRRGGAGLRQADAAE